ncbi:hypothetical protein DPEC_G00217420 [Dallia pectoralis]|uniref:Uncharacterized protein n=1 Tax=Dallia pectoralis TaxID=75939 RepID=A0ACC2G2K6_DALPE|nr:hypothetical protein DPEC_G00217420 [Dallia pectoralis]
MNTTHVGAIREDWAGHLEAWWCSMPPLQTRRLAEAVKAGPAAAAGHTRGTLLYCPGRCDQWDVCDRHVYSLGDRLLPGAPPGEVQICPQATLRRCWVRACMLKEARITSRDKANSLSLTAAVLGATGLPIQRWADCHPLSGSRGSSHQDLGYPLLHNSLAHQAGIEVQPCSGWQGDSPWRNLKAEKKVKAQRILSSNWSPATVALSERLRLSIWAERMRQR